MKILGLDTATNWCSIGLIEDDLFLGEWTIKSKMTQLNCLMPGIEMLLREKDTSLADLGGIAVTIGPGSFTGVRLGLVSARTLCQVSNLPIIGVNSLEALVFQCPVKEALVIPMIDARKGQVFAGLYRKSCEKIEECQESRLFTPVELSGELNSRKEISYFIGEGIMGYREEIIKDLDVPFYFVPEFHGIIRGATVAFLGRNKLISGKKDSCLDLMPIYIRPPDAKVKAEQI